jgi:hypothetical protein
MIKEYIVKITDDVIPDAFARFEEEYSPEQELIRCKECKRHLECDYWIENGDDWFCADGERKEGR